MNKKEWSIALLLLLLCSYVSWKNPQFLSAYNLQKQIQLIGIYGIFAIGMGIVIITGGIDLSVGSIFALQGVVLSILLVERQWPWTWAARPSTDWLTMPARNSFSSPTTLGW